MSASNVSKISVTPATARDWLKRNHGNRHLNRSRVARYAEDMRNARWVENGATIVFNDQGDLVDGQHRLEAVVLAEVAVPLLVIRNVPKLAALTIDDGLGRSHADRLRMFTRTDEDQSKVGVSTVNAAAAAVIGAALGRTNLSGQEVCDLYYKHLVGFEWAREHVHNHRLKLSPVYAALVIAYGRHPRAVEEFAEKASLGENLQRNEPALVLRRYLELPRTTRDAGGRLEVFLKALRAIQAHLRGERPSKLVASPDVLGFFSLGN